MEWAECGCAAIPEGVLFIDVVDAESKQLVWRGVTQKALPEKMPSPEEMGKNINKVVVKILIFWVQ